MRTARGKVYVRQPVADAIRRAAVTRRAANIDAQRRGSLKCLVHRLHSLRCPVNFSRAPAYGDYRGAIGSIMCRLGNRIKEALIGIGGKVDRDFWARRDA